MSETRRITDSGFAPVTIEALQARAERKEPLVSFAAQDALKMINFYAGLAHRSYLHHLGKLSKKEQRQLGADWARAATSGELKRLGLKVPRTIHLRTQNKPTA